MALRDLAFTQPMPYQPRYRITPAVLEAAEQLGAARAIVELLPLPLAQVRSLRRQTLIRVAHNSTWIENRALVLEQAIAAIESKTKRDPTRADPATEVRNYFDALELIDDNRDLAPDEDWIRRLHACIMRGSAAGRPRERSEYRETNVQVGRFTYVPPAWEDVPQLMADLARWATSAIDELPDYVLAAILAYQFVTIHPFPDGNGRTCRALATWVLRRRYDPKSLLNVEEFYVRDLDGYYDSLQMGLHFSYYDHNQKGSRSDPDLTEWLDYFCTRLGEAAKQLCREIEASFRARHPELLDDPLVELPEKARRFLVGLEQLDQTFGPAEVGERFGITTRSAREWLKSWREAGIIEPSVAGAKRVHAFKLTRKWLVRLQASGSSSGK
jgi:Fic family protein